MEEFDSAAHGLEIALTRANLRDEEKNAALEDLKGVERSWRRIEATLADAERELPADRSVRDWLRALRLLSDRARYLHDLCHYQLVAAEIGAENRDAEGSLACPPLTDPSFWKDIQGGAMEFRKQFNAVVNDRKSHYLKEDSSTMVQDADLDPFQEPVPTENLPNESKLFGRQKEFDELIRLLLEDTENGEALEVIAIAGMGGVGKTALAQHVFKHLEELQQFDITGWIFVSTNFDLIRLTRDSFNAFVRGDFSIQDLSILQENLLDMVRGKRFLLVMDDIWNKDIRKWETFVAPLRLDAGMGSKILLTAREEAVLGISEASTIIKLECLAEDDAWLLFQQHAFPSPHEENPQELVTIGKDIVKRCQGLPLAVKILASYLRYDKDPGRWRHVSESKLWNFVDVHGSGKQILGPLYFSYIHLPAHLKACYKFCSLFRRGEGVRRTELAEIWIAHGVIKNNRHGRLYEIASGYISDLESRSLYESKRRLNNQGLEFGHRDMICIHDLLFDMLEYISEGKCIVTEDDLETQGSHLLDHSRHARIILKDKGCPNFNLKDIDVHDLWVTSLPVSMQFSGFTSLRSLYITKSHHQMENKIGPAFANVSASDLRTLCDSLVGSKQLHGLTFSTKFRMLPRNTVEVPESLCKLYNLKHLDLSGLHLEALPYSIGNLRNLKHLNLFKTAIKELPAAVTNLTKLKLLNVKGTKISYMPRGISTLTGLQYLPYFVVGKAEDDGHAGIRELRNLVHLREKLQINILDNVKTEEIKGCNLSTMNFEHLRRLHLRWKCTEADQFMLEELRPHANIKDLSIHIQHGPNLPSWICDESLVNIVKLELSGFGNCSSISPLMKLPSLEELEISNFASLTELAPVQSSDLFFPKLVLLGVVECQSMKFVHVYRITSLLFFHIQSCDLLEKIYFVGSEEEAANEYTSFIRRVVIRSCKKLSVSSLEQLQILPSLEDLEIQYIQSLIEWGSVSNGDGLLFFRELKKLHISLCKSMKTVFLSRFSSLVDFRVEDSKELERIDFMGSSENVPSSLQNVELARCPMLQFSSDTLLPQSLKFFYVHKCKKLNGWVTSNRDSILAHVREVTLDDRRIVVENEETSGIPSEDDEEIDEGDSATDSVDSVNYSSTDISEETSDMYRMHPS